MRWASRARNAEWHKQSRSIAGCVVERHYYSARSNTRSTRRMWEYTDDFAGYIKRTLTFGLNMIRTRPWADSVHDRAVGCFINPRSTLSKLLINTHVHVHARTTLKSVCLYCRWNSVRATVLFTVDPQRITQTPTQCVRTLRHKHTLCSAVIATRLLQTNCWHPSITFQDVRLPTAVSPERLSPLDHENERLTTLSCSTDTSKRRLLLWQAPL